MDDAAANRAEKRPRSDESDFVAPDSKRLRVDSDLGSPDVKRIQDDLLHFFEDTDGVSDRDPAIDDLDSVIRSFAEEILAPELPPADEAQTEFGYLLGASDDELGLPPSFGSTEDDRKSTPAEGPTSFGIDFEFNGDGLPDYGSFQIGACGGPDGGSNYNEENDSQFAAIGGLFDFTDDGASEWPWRPESLPAM